MARTPGKPGEAEDGGGLLSRWSRRKLAARTEADEQPAAPPAAEVPPAEEPEEDPVHKANREAAKAVDIESLTYESDFGPFLKAGVPAILKRRALRKLWTSNPVLANLDGLNDYDADYTQPATSVFQSAWKAGRGYLDHLARQEKAADAAGPAPEVSDEAPTEEVEAAEAETQDDGERHADPAPEEPDPKPQRVSLRRRLMG